MNCITASCIISNKTVYKNGEVVYAYLNDGANGEGRVSGFLLSVYQHTGLSYPRFYKMDHLSKLGWLTTELLLADRVIATSYLAEEKGLVLSNANASLDTDLKYYESVQDIPSPSLFVYTLPNIMTGEICIRNGFKGENAFFITERFDANFMVQYVNDLMDHDILQVCICGWVDLLGEEYKSALFLIEKGKGGSTYPISFTAGAVDKIFQGENQ